MKKYETVIFDLDGTLLDTLEDLYNAVNYALRRNGMPSRTIEEVREFVGNGVKRLMELSVPGGVLNPRFGEALETFRDYYGAHCNDNTRAYDGVLQLLKELKSGGYRLAIVSNKPDSAVKDLNRIYFQDFVEAAIGEKEGVAKKPSPDTVFAALKELSMPSESAVYIGDSDVDILTAKNAGLPCISVLWGFRDKEILDAAGGTQFAGKPAEIRKFLVKEG